MDEFINYYHVLNVSPASSRVEIKEAYRNLAKRRHPDSGGSTEAMKRLNEAYRTLSDPGSRGHYDDLYRAFHSPAQAPVRTPSQSPASATPSSAAYSHIATHPASRRLHHARVRQYVWYQLEYFGPMVALSALVANGLAMYIAAGRAVSGLSVLAFLPVYWLLLRVIYLISPEIKLEVDFALRHPVKAGRGFLLPVGVILTWLPLAILWSVFLSRRFH